MVVYYCGKFVEKSSVAISPDDRGFIFADGVYEVVRAYKGRLFKLSEHLERLAYGLGELRIRGVKMADLQDAICKLLKTNGLEYGDATVYMQITRGAGAEKSQIPACGDVPDHLHGNQTLLAADQ